MSVTQTATSGALKRQGLSARSWWVGALTVLGAVVMNTVIVLAAHALLTVAPTFGPLQFVAALPTTIIAVVGALVVFALISQRSQQPVRLFRRIALVVLAISLIPDLAVLIFKLYPGTTLPQVGVLMLMHIATALLCVSMAPRLLGARM